MATKITEASLTCSICLRRFRKPRALPCLHSYCQECLIKYAPSGTRVLKCPLCQEKVSVPDGDVSKLKLDFRLQSQVEEANRYEQEACIEAEQTSRTRTHRGHPIEDRAILVSKLPCLHLSPQRMRDRLTIHFQRKRNGGGDVEGIIYPLNGCPQSAIVVFNDKQICQTALKSNQFLEEFQTKLTVQLLPPVFKRLEAEIDSFYWNLIPRLTSPQLIDDLSKRFGKTNLQTTAYVLKKVTCTPNQVEDLKSAIVNCIVKEVGLPTSVTAESGFETGIFIKNIPFLTNDTQQLREELIKHLEMEVSQVHTLISPLQGNAREAIVLFQSDKDLDGYLHNSDKCFYGERLIVSRLPHVFKLVKVHLDEFLATLVRNFDTDLFRSKLRSFCNENVIIGDNDLTCSAQQLTKAKTVILEMIGLSRQSLLQIAVIDEDQASFNLPTKTVEEAVDQIDEFKKNEFCSEVLPYDQEMWGELDTSKKDDIFTIAQKNNVRIEPFLHGWAKRIIIQGRAVDVLKAKADIQEMFTKEAEDQLINKEVQWRYKDTTGVFASYGDKINLIIERAHRGRKTHVDLELQEGTIRIEFFTMEERQLNGRGKTTVHRADLKKELTYFNLPTNWIPMTGQNSVTVPLTQGSQEFVQVQIAFRNSLRRVPVIHKIERVQVLDLYKSYVAKMERIKTSLPAGMPAERTLFHGTTHYTCDKVNRHGFNRSYCGKNGTAHGNGTYFARDASYSDGYAQPSGANNNKHMYMCNVLTGEYTQGRAGMVSPPPKPNSPNLKYDCVVDNVRNPGVFVVFNDTQAYPKYLILYS